MAKMDKIKFLSDIEIAGTMTIGESKAEILTKNDLATPDWNQNDENASDYVKNRTHYVENSGEEIEIHLGTKECSGFTIDTSMPVIAGKTAYQSTLPHSEEDPYFNYGDYPIGSKFRLEIKQSNDCIFSQILTWHEEGAGNTDPDTGGWLDESAIGNADLTGPEYSFGTLNTGELASIYTNDTDQYVSFYLDDTIQLSPDSVITISLYYLDSIEKVVQLDDKFIPDTIARVDQYDKYGKDSFSANDTAKAISAKSAAFGFNTQAGSFAYTVTALDPVAKTFTLDSVEGLEVDDIYTVDLSFYRADGTATEEIYTNYGKITAISADNVVTVDTFPSDVARYRVPDEPYIDENGLDGEENVFRVIAKPNVGNRAIGTKSFAIGNSSQALSKNSVAMGKACIAYGAHSVAIGYDNKTAYAATSFGRSNTASGVKSVAIGYNNTSSGEGSVAFGNSNTSSNKGSFASGTINKATGTNSFAAGHSNKAQGKYSIALGYNNTSSGEGSVAFGNSNISSNKGSFASGTSNKAIGTNSFALGSTNRATDKCSIALGYNNTSSGEGSIAFGNSNTSSNKGSFASGTSNNATGTNSFALGSTNRATGTSSFAHGYNNDATKTGSAVFGTNSKSQGEASFAAGASVEALGHYSQAFGYKTKATGRAAFAEGEGTIAARHQHVQGRYNIEDAAIKYAHIIGNGKDDQNRKNIYTVDWNGNGWFAGEVRVGEGKEKLVTETELKASLDKFEPSPSFIASAEAPANTSILWIDTSENGGLKYHNGTDWVTVPVRFS